MVTVLRRYIANRLASYYSQPSNFVVGASTRSIDYKSLLGEWHWRRIYKRLYEDDQQGQWLTPVELFRPHYSHVFAEYVAQHLESKKRRNSVNGEFEIIEMGGGRGTNAQEILTYLQLNHLDHYERLSKYTIVDASLTLQKLQQEVLLESEHGSKLHFSLKDLTDVAESKTSLFSSSNSNTKPTFVLGLEVLDNLGHDKLQRDPTTQEIEHALINERGMEVFEPLSGDKLLKNILIKLPMYGGMMGKPIWIPSVACGVLMEIAEKRPNSWIILADFDYLPPPDLEDEKNSERKSIYADGEPLVTSMEGVDYECYLNSPHLSDILYPTDFAKLANFCRKVFPHHSVKVTKQHQFLSDTGPVQVQATTSRWTGYSPMIYDFINCSILTLSPGSTV